MRNEVLSRRVSEAQVDASRPVNEAVNEAIVLYVFSISSKLSKFLGPSKNRRSMGISTTPFTPTRKIRCRRYRIRNLSVKFQVVGSLIDRARCSEEEEDGEVGDDVNFMELVHPLTADETRRLAESWKKRYSTEALSDDTPELGKRVVEVSK